MMDEPTVAVREARESNGIGIIDNDILAMGAGKNDQCSMVNQRSLSQSGERNVQ